MRKLIIFLTFLGSIQLYAQGCVADISLTTAETVSPILHQASNTITASTAYGVSSGYNATLRAGVLIELKDNTHIKEGAFFLAQIGECIKKKSIDNVSDSLLVSRLQVYPNPAESVLNLSADNMEMSAITVTALDGRVIATYNANNESSLQLDLASYASGVYLLTVETIDGQMLRQRFIKE